MPDPVATFAEANQAKQNAADARDNASNSANRYWTNATSDHGGFSTESSHQSDTVLDITGSGWLVGFHTAEGDLDILFTFDIDGGTIYGITLEQGAGAGIVVWQRFTSSVTVACNSSDAGRVAAVVLDP